MTFIISRIFPTFQTGSGQKRGFPAPQQPQSPARPPRRSRDNRPLGLGGHGSGGRSHNISSRELELRNEMGSVLDRVAEWSRYYDRDVPTTSTPRKRFADTVKSRIEAPTQFDSLAVFFVFLLPLYLSKTQECLK